MSPADVRSMKRRVRWRPVLWAAGGTLLAGPASAAEAPASNVSIRPVSNEAVRLTVSGRSGSAYGLAATEDFRSWTNWPAQRADALGQVQFTVPAAGRQLFFRAFAERASLLPPEAALGQRLFLEPRFAQYYHAHSGGDLNRPLAAGDPVLEETVTQNFNVPGAFAGQAMSCRVCHMVDEHREDGLGTRAFSDFAIRSPIPERGDGRSLTVRNSPPLANASIGRPGSFFLHFDGEFADGAALAKGTFTGRNFGWRPEEREQALSHIAKVIREDDGTSFRGAEFGGAYRTVLAGSDPALPGEFRLPEPLRLEVAQATDEQILERIGTFVDAYMKTLRFGVDAEGVYERSPYDHFLKKNGLPRRPAAGEGDLEYSRRLRGLVSRLAEPVFVTAEDGAFRTHAQAFAFGARELEGLKVFMAEPSPEQPMATARIGNCIACHAAPHFTDFDFHNTGATQWEYDAVHGEGEFARIPIPSWAERAATPDAFLPPTPARPQGTGQFLAIPESQKPGQVDLGLWNIYGNPDFPASQAGIESLLRARFGALPPEAMLEKTVALFKTPGLRDLSHSAPYLHTGQASNIEAAIFFYRFTSDLARQGLVRNSDEDMREIRLSNADASALAAFLRALNEDFE